MAEKIEEMKEVREIETSTSQWELEKEHIQKIEEILDRLYAAQDMVAKAQELIEGHVPNSDSLTNGFKELEARMDYKISFYQKIVMPVLEKERKGSK